MVKTITCTIDDNDYRYINELDKPMRFYISLGVKAFKQDFDPNIANQETILRNRIAKLTLELEKVLRENEELKQIEVVNLNEK